MTIITDGEYDVNWGSNLGDRYITFGLVQESCNIKITILDSPTFAYEPFNQIQLDVPCYRGFNTFWYGDINLVIENFISKYDSTYNERTFYFTDNPANFSNDINDKETVIVIDRPDNDWIKNIRVGKTADLIINETSNNPNYMCSYVSDWYKKDATAAVGGSSSNGRQSGLTAISYTDFDIEAYSYGFGKCYIID